MRSSDRRRSARIAVAVLGAGALAASVAGCSAGGNPVASPTPTPDITFVDEPVADALHPWCVELYAAQGEPLYEGELRHRPDGWPAPPEGAVLCAADLDGPLETGYYATDRGIDLDDVFWHYENAFPDSVPNGQAATDEGPVLTGVMAPVSFYVEGIGDRKYAIHWAVDGDYGE